jgi:hypothetical protein
MASWHVGTAMGIVVGGAGGGVGRHAWTRHVVLIVHDATVAQPADQDTDVLLGGEKRMVDRRWTHMLHYACLVAVAQLACPLRPYLSISPLRKPDTANNKRIIVTYGHWCWR